MDIRRVAITLAVLIIAVAMTSGCGQKTGRYNWNTAQEKYERPAPRCNGSMELIGAALDSFYNMVRFKINNTGGMPLENFTVITSMKLGESRRIIPAPSMPGGTFEINVSVRSDVQSIYMVSSECEEARIEVRDYEISGFNFSKQGENPWQRE